ncbi:uncharacterized protein [Lolium perenne]|uniref:uncharacterized protein isoform X2 n=1 Tax=Lolium perenne TaxID=4522 RepID=UPI003A9A17FC
MGGAAARGTGSCRTPEAWAGWQGGGLLLVSCQGVSHAPSSSHIGGCWCFCASLPSRRWSRPAWGGATASAVEASEGRSGGCDVEHDHRGDERWRRFLGFGYHILDGRLQGAASSNPIAHRRTLRADHSSPQSVGRHRSMQIYVQMEQRFINMQVMATMYIVGACP